MVSSNASFAGWPEAAKRLVRAAVDRHGGWDAWQRFGRLRVECTHFDGLVGVVKGAHRTFTMPRTLLVDPKAGRTAILEHPAAGRSTVFHDGAITVVNADAPGAPEAHPHYRAEFRTLRRQFGSWSDLDIAYFLGYSQANYLSYPFALPELRYVAHRRWDRGRGEAVTLDYPPGADCHSTRQTYCFDSTALLRRVDYSVDIVGPGSMTSQHYENYTTIAGVLYPRRRRVNLRIYRLVTRLNLLTLDFELSHQAA